MRLLSAFSEPDGAPTVRGKNFNRNLEEMSTRVFMSEIAPRLNRVIVRYTRPRDDYPAGGAGPAIYSRTAS